MTKLKAVDSSKQLDAELCGDFTVNERTGEAYISQRKAAELCGVARNSIVHFFKEKGDISQGLNIDQLDSVVQHYCTKGKQEAVQFMMKCAKAGYKAFIYHEAGYKMEAVPGTPKTFAEALRLAADQQEKIEMLESRIEGDAHKVDLYSTLFSQNKPVSMNQFAKLISDSHGIKVGQNNLMAFLRDSGYLMAGRDSSERNRPYQKYMELAWFEVEYTKTKIGQIPHTVVMPKGIEELAEHVVARFSN